ncbi:RusA family crossover junction endodeoxyribonuclease [Pseudomonas helleri]|uniref:RusA family crossover junction endodeoxyribonuclease n=1 Tax=Pseudomonas helleri TaxID=1608996 RepID=UPI003FD62942
MTTLKPVSFVVPGEPQGKGRPRVGSVAGQARMFTPAKTLAYEGVIAFAAQQAMDGRALITGPVLLEMHMLHPIRDSWSKKKKAGALAGEIAPTIKCDADNCLKAVCDALNGIVWKDDVQVVNVSLSKRFAETPGVRVRIVPLAMLPA